MQDPWIQNSLKVDLAVLKYERRLLILSEFRMYQAKQKFQQIALGLIIHQLLPVEFMEEQRQMFKVLDRNGDGMLSRNELEEAFAEHGINVKVEEMNELMRNTDMSGD